MHTNMIIHKKKEKNYESLKTNNTKCECDGFFPVFSFEMHNNIVNANKIMHWSWNPIYFEIETHVN